MSLRSQPFERGTLRGTIYTFEKAGDRLDMHSHDKTTVHVTFIGKGPVEVTNGDWIRTGMTGDFWDFDPGQHEFTALVDGAKIYNIIKG